MLNFSSENKGARTYDYCAACMFYLGAILVTLIMQAVAGVLSAALVKSVPDIAVNADFNTAFMICIQIANGLFIFLYTKRRNHKFDFRLYRTADGRVCIADFIVPVVLAALVMIAMYLPTVWYGYFTHYALHLSPELGNISLDTASSVVMIVIASVFLAPTCEETIYRGVLFNGLRREKSAVKAVLLSSLAFMLMHMSPVQVVFQFALGAVSAAVMCNTKRLLPSVLFHAAANSLALIIQMTPLSAVLYGCETWLTQNAAAAVFITLGLFVGGGAAVFAVIKLVYANPWRTQLLKTNNADQAEGAEISGQGDRVLSDARRKDGTFRFYVAIAICLVMFVINLAVNVV